MSSNNTKSVPSVTSNITNTTEEPYKYDITKEDNSKIRHLMSYYGY